GHVERLVGGDQGHLVGAGDLDGQVHLGGVPASGGADLDRIGAGRCEVGGIDLDGDSLGGSRLDGHRGGTRLPGRAGADLPALRALGLEAELDLLGGVVLQVEREAERDVRPVAERRELRGQGYAATDVFGDGELELQGVRGAACGRLEGDVVD